MPFVNVQMLSGRNQEQKDEMAKRIVDAISTIGRCRASEVQVVFTEVAKSDWFVGNKQQSQSPLGSTADKPNTGG